jgi:NADPH-dependent glutamate synthase beta subunit-like oxidoreductase
MLADAVPVFALPCEALRADVEALVMLGVEIRCNARVGQEITCKELEDEFDAVLVATGARQGIVPRVPGRELAGVTDAVSFSRLHAAGGSGVVAGPVVVLGGGRAASLVARTARRAGADQVTLVHTAPRELWPAGADELELAEAEGVRVLPGHRVVRLEGAGAALAAVVAAKARFAQPDRVGRVRVTGNGPETRIEARVLVAASERVPAAGDAPLPEGVARGPLCNLMVAPGSYRLGRVRWYAAGEAATGAATLVDSMATGRLAAESIARDLGVAGGKP